MPVIVEGPDGSGKSTLAARLEEAGLELQPRHITSKGEISPGTHDLTHWSMEQISHWQQKPMQASTWLYDRFPLFGEVIHGPVFRGMVRDEDMLSTLTQVLWQQRVLVVVCLPDMHQAWDNVKMDEGEQHPDLTWERYQQIWWSYWKLINWSPRVMQYDYQDDPEATTILHQLGLMHQGPSFTVGLN